MAAKAATSGDWGQCASNAGHRAFRQRKSGCGAAFLAKSRSAIACGTCRGCIGPWPAGSQANRRRTRIAIGCWRGFRGCGTCIRGMCGGAARGGGGGFWGAGVVAIAVRVPRLTAQRFATTTSKRRARATAHKKSNVVPRGPYDRLVYCRSQSLRTETPNIIQRRYFGPPHVALFNRRQRTSCFHAAS